MEDKYKLLKGIIICKRSGEYLVDLILDSTINPVLLSSFVGALGLFGEENLGKIEEIHIKGLDVEMIVVYKFDLVLIAIMDKKLKKIGIREEAERALTLFTTLYNKFDEHTCLDVSIFEEFKEILKAQVSLYFNNLQKSDNTQIPDFGFFTEAIKKMRDQTN